jgi:uroporphyrinogen-III decarboxylase
LKEERFQVRLKERLPPNWTEVAKQLRSRDFPLALGSYPGGYFGCLRYLMGEMRLLTAYYDEPSLLHDIASFLTDFWIEIYGSVLQDVDADSFEIWEDMCYKGGPLISPQAFREFMMPYYKRLIGFLRSQGIRNFHVDTDGDCTKLIPLFLESGVTGLFPFEVQAGMDIRKVREDFPQLRIMGGLDKVSMARGRKEIDLELDSKLPYMLERGGYIPYMDHLVPPEFGWQEFRHYRERLSELVNKHSMARPPRF